MLDNIGGVLVPISFLGILWFLIDRFTLVRQKGPLYRVVHCADGDTCTVISPKGVKFTVRFAYLDALEMDQGGAAAKKALEGKILNKYVTLKVTDKDDGKGRVVAQVFLRGKDVGKWLVSHRWAYDYKTYSKGYYAKEEKLAKYLYFWRGAFRKMPWKHRYDKRMGKNIKFSLVLRYFCTGIVVSVVLMFIFSHLYR